MRDHKEPPDQQVLLEIQVPQALRDLPGLRGLRV
jgi:hypothetical protein